MKEKGSCTEIRNYIDSEFNWRGISSRDQHYLNTTRSLMDNLPLYLQADVCYEDEFGDDE